VRFTGHGLERTHKTTCLYWGAYANVRISPSQYGYVLKNTDVPRFNTNLLQYKHITKNKRGSC